jgi:hypothetical protein
VKLALAATGEEMVMLVAFGEAEEQARERVTAVETAARQATADLAEAREALVQLEAGSPTTQERTKAEKALAQAEENAAKPWRERLEGAQRGAREARQSLARFAREHRAALVAEVEERGRDVADQVDHAGEAFIAAINQRMVVERDLTAIVALTRPMQPGDISRARSDEARQAVARFLQLGGEDGPTLRIETPEAIPEVTAA